MNRIRKSIYTIIITEIRKIKIVYQKINQKSKSIEKSKYRPKNVNIYIYMYIYNSLFITIYPNVIIVIHIKKIWDY